MTQWREGGNRHRLEGSNDVAGNRDYEGSSINRRLGIMKLPPLIFSNSLFKLMKLLPLTQGFKPLLLDV
jgi:hypothetical protein